MFIPQKIIVLKISLSLILIWFNFTFAQKYGFGGVSCEFGNFKSKNKSYMRLTFPEIFFGPENWNGFGFGIGGIESYGSEAKENKAYDGLLKEYSYKTTFSLLPFSAAYTYILGTGYGDFDCMKMGAFALLTQMKISPVEITTKTTYYGENKNNRENKVENTKYSASLKIQEELIFPIFGMPYIGTAFYFSSIGFGYSFYTKGHSLELITHKGFYYYVKIWLAGIGWE